MKRYSMAGGAGSVDILNMRLCKVDEPACVMRILAGLALGQGGWVVTSNIDTLRRHVFEPQFRQLIAEATLVVADGMPLVWASKVQGSPLPARVAGASLISSLSAAAAQHGRSVFLLGGDPGTAEAAAAVLQQRSPGLRIAGTWCPPLGFERDAQHLAALRAALQRAAPDIVYVGLSCPKQEWLISQLKGALPASWWLGLGYSFSFLARRTKRAPRWMQDAGMEWLHRLLQEPRRLARRYLVQGVPFVLYVLSRSLLVRVRKGISP
jgi:N-acetylglucosaminyldiphosphoundecaprenol N-acetyl-beta-D-mannosaminyltransferase